MRRALNGSSVRIRLSGSAGLARSAGPGASLPSWHTPVRRFAAALLLASGVLLLFISQQTAAAQEPQAGAPVIRVIDMNTTVDIVSARYLKRSINGANDDGAELIVIELDTPGGTLDSTRDMVTSILGSRVPVVVFVSPEGAQAASAGTFISAASGLLAMAPATNIGAAAVVDGSGADLPETLASKVTQDTAAFMRSIADERGRNSRALEDTVLLAAAYSANEAVELGIADLIARDLSDLLAQIDGRSIQAFEGDVTVSTAGAQIERREMSFVDNVISFLANPNVAFLLISLGTVGLIVELWSPGLWIPGTLGVAMLVLGWVGIGNLDFSWAGVIFLALAIVLFVLEAEAPGVSYFGAAGAVSLVIGGVFLAGRLGDPDLRGGVQTVSLWLVSVLGASVLGFVLWLAWQIRQSAKTKPWEGEGSTSGLVGDEAVVTSDLDPAGEVHIAGEFWSAELVSGAFAPPGTVVAKGERVRVVRVDGLRLFVEPLASGAAEPDARSGPNSGKGNAPASV